MLLLPPILGFSLAIISIILHFVFPIAKIISYPYNLLGILGITIGVILVILGKKTFEKFKTPLRPGAKPTALVTTGPFRMSRNPMYLGFVVILLGISVILGSLITFISPVIFFLVIHFGFIPFEEKLMENNFGKEYLDYKKKVRKWI